MNRGGSVASVLPVGPVMVQVGFILISSDEVGGGQGPLCTRINLLQPVDRVFQRLGIQQWSALQAV